MLDFDGTAWFIDEGLILTSNHNSVMTRDLLGKARQTTPAPIKNIPPIKDAAASRHHCILLDEEGTVFVFGLNDSHQLGTGVTGNIFQATRLENLPPITHIATEQTYSIFMDEDNQLWGCGQTIDSGFNYLDQDECRDKLCVIRPIRIAPQNQDTRSLKRICNYMDTCGNIWTIPGDKWLFAHSKHIKIRGMNCCVTELNSQFPSELYKNGSASKLGVYPELLTLFNEEILRYEHELIMLMVKEVRIDSEYISSINQLIQTKYYFYNHLSTLLTPFLSLTPDSLSKSIAVYKATLIPPVNFYVPGLMRILELYQYLIAQHEQDQCIIKADQASLLCDFALLLVNLKVNGFATRVDLESHLQRTANGLKAKSDYNSSRLFQSALPSRSNPYMDIREKLLDESLSKLSNVANVFIKAFISFESNDGSRNSAFIKLITQDIETKLALLGYQPSKGWGR